MLPLYIEMLCCALRGRSEDLRHNICSCSAPQNGFKRGKRGEELTGGEGRVGKGGLNRVGKSPELKAG